MLLAELISGVELIHVNRSSRTCSFTSFQNLEACQSCKAVLFPQEAMCREYLDRKQNNQL